MSTMTDGRRLKRQSIALRLAFALGAVMLVIGLVSVSCLWAIFDIHRRLHALKADEEKARTVVRLASAVRDQYAHVAHTIIIGNESHVRLFREATLKLRTLTQAVRDQGDPSARQEIDRIAAASQEIERLFDAEVLPLIRAGDSKALAEHHDRILGIAMGAQNEAESLAAKAEASMEDLSRHVSATQHGAILLTIIAHVVALATAVLVGLYLYRTIARPIAKLAAAASRVGGGDLETEIPIERDDELGRLSRRFNEMMASVKVHQRQLVQSERLVGLASMSAGIAHELNNPIGVILGYAKLLARRSEPVDPKMLATIEEEAERCQQVIEGLLELTRGGVLRATTVDLRMLVENVVGSLRIKGAAPGVAIDVRGGAMIEGDEARLRQVVTNLIANALDACGDRGTVTVTVAIDVSRPGMVTMDVSDTGSGVAAEARDRIFEPFFTTKAAGSGLGLAISRAIARAHGGDVALGATTDRGATFRVTLPSRVEAPS